MSAFGQANLHTIHANKHISGHGLKRVSGQPSA